MSLALPGTATGASTATGISGRTFLKEVTGERDWLLSRVTPHVRVEEHVSCS